MNTLNEKIQLLQNIVDNSNSIVFFGGAGVSTESGIPDFRSTSGLYNQEWKYPPEKIVSRTFFDYNCQEFYRFYCKKMIALEAKPNPAHFKLGLHQMAGSKKVFELHGSVHRNYCTNCKSFYDANFILEENAKNPDGIPRCKKCNHIVKPDVVLYEEPLDNQTIENSINAISQADTLIIGGTSLVVYPASGLVRYFKGKNLVIINMSPTDYDKNSTLLIQGKIGEVLSNINC